MRSVPEFVPVVLISSQRGASYDQVFNTLNIARSRVMSLSPRTTKSVFH